MINHINITLHFEHYTLYINYIHPMCLEITERWTAVPQTGTLENTVVWVQYELMVLQLYSMSACYGKYVHFYEHIHSVMVLIMWRINLYFFSSDKQTVLQSMLWHVTQLIATNGLNAHVELTIDYDLFIEEKMQS